MDKLPGVGIRYQVLRIMRFLHTTYYLPHTTSQSGFAPVALVVLLLFGIAAGTLLVQQRTNLLPKAAEPRGWDWPFVCSFPDSQTLVPAESTKYGSNCPDNQYVKFSHCQYSPNNLIVTDVNKCQYAYDSLNHDKYTFYCKWSNECSASPPAPAAPDVPAAPAPAAASKTCSDDMFYICLSYGLYDCETDQSILSRFRCKYATTQTECSIRDKNRLSCPPNQKCTITSDRFGTECSQIPENTCRDENILIDANRLAFDCSEIGKRCTGLSGSAKCASQAPQQPAAPAAGQTPGISAGTCTAKQITDLRNCPTVDNKPRCIITEAGSPQCQYTEDFSDECNRAHYEKCQTNASTYNLETSLCYVIDGVPRCEYKGKDAGCNPEDKICENGTVCKIFTKKVNNKDINYSACVKSSSPAEAAPQPAAAPKARPPSGPAAPAGGAPADKTGGKTEPVCGKNSDGVEIPCYKIGTFDEDTEAQLKDMAATSLLRYDQYTEVLTKIAKYIEDLKAKVDAKNDLARKAALACTSPTQPAQPQQPQQPQPPQPNPPATNTTTKLPIIPPAQ